jgi:hypothetical protein
MVYGGERMMAYLFLPSSAKPPYSRYFRLPASDAVAISAGPRMEFNARKNVASRWQELRMNPGRNGSLTPHRLARRSQNPVHFLGASTKNVKTYGHWP